MSPRLILFSSDEVDVLEAGTCEETPSPPQLTLPTATLHPLPRWPLGCRHRQVFERKPPLSPDYYYRHRSMETSASGFGGGVIDSVAAVVSIARENQ
ncbi:hypothetical protein V6N13_071880 [Hibiscus sabdariffa]|uniref:Uncharacterized protein n=1 Tax=Hibiscus sabdariffa TaxID=183260 RepID=A0ABR2TC75_9ROSI